MHWARLDSYRAEGTERVPDRLLYVLVRYLSGRVFIEDGVHQSDLRRASARLRFRRTVLNEKQTSGEQIETLVLPLGLFNDILEAIHVHLNNQTSALCIRGF